MAGTSAGSLRRAIQETAIMTRLSSFFRPAVILTAFGIGCAPAPSGGVEQKKAEPAKTSAPATAGDEAKQFCANNLVIAGDARIAWQTSKLLELEARVKQRLEDLEARKVQLVEWLGKHDEAMKKATDDIVTIYSHMKPDAAASQLAVMDDAMAAALIAKLPPRAASMILDEMEPARAAQLTHGMVVPETVPSGKKS